MDSLPMAGDQVGRWAEDMVVVEEGLVKGRESGEAVE